MSAAVKHLDHLNLSVRGFEETADWYRRVFGFEVVEDEVDSDGVRWGVIRGGDAMLCIYEQPDLADLPRYEAGTHFIRHFGLRITDRKAWEETVARERLDLQYGGEVSWPHSSAWYTDDPTGYTIEVVLWDDDSVRFPA